MADAASSAGRPPAGWTMDVDAKKGTTVFVTRTGKRVSTMNEVHNHLKNELAANDINEDEALWLKTLERYGQNCRHWAIARSAVAGSTKFTKAYPMPTWFRKSIGK